MSKRILAMFLAVLMIVSMFPVSAFADVDETVVVDELSAPTVIDAITETPEEELSEIVEEIPEELTEIVEEIPEELSEIVEEIPEELSEIVEPSLRLKETPEAGAEFVTLVVENFPDGVSYLLAKDGADAVPLTEEDYTSEDCEITFAVEVGTYCFSVVGESGVIAELYFAIEAAAELIEDEEVIEEAEEAEAEATGELLTLSGDSHTHKDATGADVTFQPWESDNSLPTEGNWYLTDNVTLSANWEINANVNLCLNDKIINLNGEYISVEETGTFKLYDCGTGTTRYWNKGADGLWTLAADQNIATDYTTTGGVITGGYTGFDGGAVAVAEQSSFVMNGGTICGNVADNGGGVYNKGSFTMYGGTICGNVADKSGGGVENDEGTTTMLGGIITGNTCGGTCPGGIDNWDSLILGGTAVVTGNLMGTVPNDVKGGTISISTDTAPENGMNVGLYGEDTVVTGASEGDEQYFFADDTTKYVKYESEGAKLVLADLPPHTHTDADGNVITFQPWESDNSLPTEGNWYLTDNVTLSANWEINANVNLCLNDKVINLNGKNIAVADHGKFELYDCGKTVRYWNKDANGLWKLAADQSKATDYTTTGGCIIGGNVEFGGGVGVAQGGSFVMNGGTICGNNAQCNGGDTGIGGGVYVSGSFVMNDGAICGNTADGYGGGGVGVAQGGSFVMNGGSICNNTAIDDGWGGGVYAEGSFVMNGGTIRNNFAGEGGVLVYCYGTIKLLGGEISGNTAAWECGGVGTYGGVAIVLGGKVVIKDNTAYGQPSDLCAEASIDATTKPQEGMEVGLGNTDIVVTNASEGDEQYFFSDDLNYEVAFNNNDTPDDQTDDYLGLVAHTHVDAGGDNVCDVCEKPLYLDRVWDESSKKVVETLQPIPDDAIELTDQTTELSDGWYIVTGSDVKTTNLKVTGNANLILADGSKLTAKGNSNKAGITVSGGGTSLTVYAQSIGDNMGTLIATGSYNAAGIGGGRGAPGSNITVNGGNVTATGGDGDNGSAGIGGGEFDSGSNITINGGTVTATGRKGGAGIGGGEGGSGSNITVNGGTVTAISVVNGAGIGGGWRSSGSNITINGGTVTAISVANGAGIGCGADCMTPASNITIYANAAITAGESAGNATATTAADYLKSPAKYIHIEPGHVHSFTSYSADGAVLTATCTAGDCDLPDSKLTLTLTGDVAANAAAVKAWNDAGAATATFAYYAESDTKFENPLDAPVKSGKYTVKATVSDKTASLEFDYVSPYWYMDPDPETGKVELETAPDVIVTADTKSWNGWVYATGTVKIDGAVTMTGEVNLILADGAELEITGGITGEGKTLTVYAQTNGSGKLTVIKEQDDSNAIDASIIVNDGEITISCSGAGTINGVAGDVTVNGGKVSIDGESRNYKGDGVNGSVKISGGKVQIIGKSQKDVGTGIENGTISVTGDGELIMNGSTKATNVAKENIDATVKYSDADNGTAYDKEWDGKTALNTYKYLKLTEAATVELTRESTVTKYKTLAEALTAAQDGDTVKLTSNAKGDGIVIPEGTFTTGLTLDLGGFTYTVDGALVGSTNTQTNGFQFLKGNKITMSNGTINVGDNATGKTADGEVKECRILIQNYSDLTLDGVTLDGSKLKDSRTDRGTYTLSNCCGNTELTGKTEIKASTAETDPSFAFDTDEKTGYTKPSVTVNGADVVITGDVELSGGDLTLTAGTLTGALKGDKGNGTVTKAATFTAEAPTGCGWDKDGKLIKAEAELDGAAYATLAEAVAEAQDGKTVKLLDNVTTNGFIVPEGVTLDLNNKTLTPGEAFAGIQNKGVIVAYQENNAIIDTLLYNVPGKYKTGEAIEHTFTSGYGSAKIPAGSEITASILPGKDGGFTNGAAQKLEFTVPAGGKLEWSAIVAPKMQLIVNGDMSLSKNVYLSTKDAVEAGNETSVTVTGKLYIPAEIYLGVGTAEEYAAMGISAPAGKAIIKAADYVFGGDDTGIFLTPVCADMIVSKTENDLAPDKGLRIAYPEGYNYCMIEGTGADEEWYHLFSAQSALFGADDSFKGVFVSFADAYAAAADGDALVPLVNMTLTEQLVIDKAVRIGGQNVITIDGSAVKGAGAILVNNAAASLTNLTVIGPNTTIRSGNSGWDNGEYGIKFYQADGAKLNNVTVKEGNAGIQVNGGSVTMTGKIDVSGNEWGGIEVCNKGVLDISGAELVNVGETEANPVLWNDGDKDDSFGTVTFSEDQPLYKKVVKNDKENKEHYYTDGAAKLTDASGNTFGYRTLEEALNAAQDDDTVTLLKDITTEGFTVPDGVTLDLNKKTVTPANPAVPAVFNKGTIKIYSANADQLGYLLYDAVDANGGKYITGEHIKIGEPLEAGLGSNTEILAKRTADGKQSITVTVNADSSPKLVAWNLPVGKDTEITVIGKLQVLKDIEIKGKVTCTTLTTSKTITLTDGGQLIVTDLKSAVDDAKKAITDAAGNTPSDTVKAIVEEYNGTNDAAGEIDKKADPTGISSTNTVDAAKTEIEKLKAEALFKVYRQQEAEELIAEYGEGSEKVRTILDSANSILAVNYDPANSLEDNKTAVDNAVEALKEALDLQIAKEEAAAAIEEAAGQPEFRTETMNAIVDEFLNSETGSITTATDIEQINTVLLPDALARIEKQHQLDCRYEEKLPISGSENVKLYLNGKYVGDVSIHEVRGGYAIETADGFLCFRNGRFYKSETEMFAWRYNGVGFCVTQDTAAGKGALVRLVDLIVSLIRTDGWWYESYTTYYLSSLNGVSTLPVKAELRHDVYGKGGHDYGPWISNGDGTHTRYCTNCDKGKQTATCVYDQPGDKCVCGAINPNVYNVNASVSKATRKALFITQYTYTIKPDVHGATVRKVEYSLDGGIVWLNGTSFILPNNNFSYRFRITDSTGHVTYFTVKNGTNVTKQ